MAVTQGIEVAEMDSSFKSIVIPIDLSAQSILDISRSEVVPTDDQPAGVLPGKNAE